MKSLPGRQKSAKAIERSSKGRNALDVDSKEKKERGEALTIHTPQSPIYEYWVLSIFP
jgi:hypothetical protein